MNGGGKLKKYLFVIALLALVIFASGCTQNGTNQTSSSSNSYSVGGISFNYPENWIVTSITMTNQSFVKVEDSQSAQSNGTKGDIVTITKAPKSANRTVETITNQVTQSNAANVTNGTMNVAGVTANQFTQTGNQNGTQIETKLIYFEKSSMIYTLQLITIGNTIQSQQQYFDIILNSLKVQ
jgi:hypothetical protein